MQFERTAAFKWCMIHCRMGSEKQIQGDLGEDVFLNCFIAESFSFSTWSPASRQAVSYELADLMTKHGYFLTLRSINRRGRKICSHWADAVTVWCSPTDFIEISRLADVETHRKGRFNEYLVDKGALTNLHSRHCSHFFNLVGENHHFQHPSIWPFNHGFSIS